jgi:hypothetical protein
MAHDRIAALALGFGLLLTGLIPQTTATEPVEPPAVAQPTAPVAEPADEPAPQPEPSETSKPEPTETVAPAEPDKDAATAPLAEAIRDAFPEAPYPGVAFFEGTWGEYTPVTDDRVVEPGVYAGVIGILSNVEPRLVKYAGGTATVTPGRFDGFKNTTELVITVTEVTP